MPYYLAIFLFLLAYSATADVSVDGHFRKDGTYVQPHHRSSPNSDTNDNWSTQGNVNPYTGEKGHIEPDDYSYSKSSTTY